MGLAKELKEGTKKSHSAAENTKFVRGFLKGVVNEEEYRKLLTNFYYVYSCMEDLISKTNDPLAKTLQKYQSKLDRTNFLEQDLRYYYGPMWRSLIKPTEQCQRYVNRISEVAEDDPELLVGHLYTRYMGDLSGGQILKGIAEKAMVLREGEGLHFYDFKDISDKKGFKTRYRSSLDSLPINQSEANAIINEANYAFRLNMYMFDELEGNWIQSLLQFLFGFLR